MAEPKEPAYGKNINELQQNIVFKYDNNGDAKVKGILNYVEDYPGFEKGAKGNFLAIECQDAKEGYEVKWELSEAQKKGEGVLNGDDYVLVCNIHSNSQTIKFTLVEDEYYNTTFDLSELILDQDISKVMTARDGNLDTYNKKVSDLQQDITIQNNNFGKGKASGTLKWVTGWSNPAYAEGNVLALHIDNTKLPQGEVKYVLGTQEASPDTSDWNVNLRLDGKSDKTFKIKVNGQILYELDCSELVLTPNN